MRSFSIVIIACLLVGSIGCDSSPKDENASETREKENTGLSGSPSYKIPFEGIIRAKQWADSVLNSADLTYSLSENRIRREAVSRNPIDKILRSDHIAGIICDMTRDEVLLYRTKDKEKYFVRMKQNGYRDKVKGIAYTTDMLKYGFGTIFLGLPSKRVYLSKNESDAVTVNGIKCDRFTINYGGLIVTVIEADHSNSVEVNRELMKLVEPNLPDQVTGFPFRLRRAQLPRKVLEEDSSPKDKSDEILMEGLKAIAKSVEKLLEAGMEISEVSENKLPHSVFRLSPDFIELQSFQELETKFSDPEGDSDFDWD